MEQDTYKTKVIFRKFPEGDILALFPEISADFQPYHCLSYMHIGQHSAADINAMVINSKLATPTEYADLKAELESIGYNLHVCKRYTYAMFQNRCNAMKG